MPELPEVEVTRLGLVDVLCGAVIRSVVMGKPLRWPLGTEPALLRGRRITGLRRRGKYLLMDLDAGMLLLHLGMSGSLSLQTAGVAPGAHDHCDIVTDRGTLRLHDPRRFGAVVFAPGENDPAARKLLGRLGVEPLGDAFTPELLHAGLKMRTAPVKQVLLAGELVVGVGNIYASEALFLAGIRPQVRARRISRARAQLLHAAIRMVLQRAVEAGGSTLRNFTSASGERGYFQLQAMVYGRAGEPCRVCASAIKVLVQGQRSSFFCPTCQKP